MRRLAVAAANIGQWDWDLRTGKIVYSSEWKRQIGHEDDEIADRLEEWSSRVHPDDFDRAWDLAERYIAGRASKYDLEFRFRHKNGSYRWIYCAGILLRDDASTPVRFMGVHIDINTLLANPGLLPAARAMGIPVFTYDLTSDKEHAQALLAAKRQSGLLPSGAIINGRPDAFCQLMSAQ